MQARVIDAKQWDELLMRRQIVAFLEEYCRGLTLHDVREWYDEAFPKD